MTTDNLLAALSSQLSPDKHRCLCCGHEHRCSTQGCRIVREAIAQLEKSRWIPVTESLPEASEMVLVSVSGKPRENITLKGAIEIAEYDPEGWILEMWPDWMDANITHWMPLPEPPKGD